MFKVGDMVKVKSGADTRLSNSDEFEVKAVSDTGQIFIREYDFQGKLDSFDPMIFTLSGGNSPIRTVTRREILPGYYGIIKLGGSYNGCAIMDLRDNSGHYTAEELREAAHIFNQIAEVLEENQ